MQPQIDCSVSCSNISVGKGSQIERPHSPRSHITLIDHHDLKQQKEQIKSLLNERRKIFQAPNHLQFHTIQVTNKSAPTPSTQNQDQTGSSFSNQLQRPLYRRNKRHHTGISIQSRVPFSETSNTPEMSRFGNSSNVSEQFHRNSIRDPGLNQKSIALRLKTLQMEVHSIKQLLQNKGQIPVQEIKLFQNKNESTLSESSTSEMRESRKGAPKFFNEKEFPKLQNSKWRPSKDRSKELVEAVSTQGSQFIENFASPFDLNAALIQFE